MPTGKSIAFVCIESLYNRERRRYAEPQGSGWMGVRLGRLPNMLRAK